MNDCVEPVGEPKKSARQVVEAEIRDSLQGWKGSGIIAGPTPSIQYLPPPNPLAELLRGMPPGTSVTLTIDTKTEDKPCDPGF